MTRLGPAAGWEQPAIPAAEMASAHPKRSPGEAEVAALAIYASGPGSALEGHSEAAEEVEAVVVTQLPNAQAIAALSRPNESGINMPGDQPAVSFNGRDLSRDGDVIEVFEVPAGELPEGT